MKGWDAKIAASFPQKANPKDCLYMKFTLARQRAAKLGAGFLFQTSNRVRGSVWEVEVFTQDRIVNSHEAVQLGAPRRAEKLFCHKVVPLEPFVFLRLGGRHTDGPPESQKRFRLSTSSESKNKVRNQNKQRVRFKTSKVQNPK